MKAEDIIRCEQLLKEGYSVEAKDLWNRRVLYWSALRGSRPICELLIVFGAEVDGVSENGAIALHGAAQKGSVDVADVLVKR